MATPLHNPEIPGAKLKHWMKAGLGVLYTKEGIEPFVYDEIEQFQQKCLRDIRKTNRLPADITCSSCSTENVVVCPTDRICNVGRGPCSFHRNSSTQYLQSGCPKKICHNFKNEIQNAHRFYGPSYKNTDAYQWCSNPWEVAKCFMPPDGYNDVTSAAETDLSGIISVIKNYKPFQPKVDDDLSKRNNIFDKAIEVEKAVRHSPHLGMEDEDLKQYLSILHDVLTDPGYLASNPNSRKAEMKLSQLKNDTLLVGIEDIHKVINNVAKAAENELRNEKDEDKKKAVKQKLEMIQLTKKSICESGRYEKISLSEIEKKLQHAHGKVKEEAPSIKRKVHQDQEDEETAGSTDRKMLDTFKSYIDKSRRKLTTYMTPDPILDYFLEHKIFDFQETRDIREAKNTTEKNRMILDKTRCKDEHCYENLKTCLVKTNQELLFKLLECIERGEDTNILEEKLQGSVLQVEDDAYTKRKKRVYTRESMKNYKSLEAHNAFRSGWVETVHCYKIPDTQNILLSAKVKPSQRLNEEPYSPWIVASKHGQILAAHCNCMAGLGESCSHVAAILFKIEAAVRLGYTTKACTEQPCEWNKDFVKKIGPDRIAKIDFFKEKAITKAKTRRKKRKQEFSPTNANKQNEFLSSLNELKSKPVVLSCFEQYSESFHWKKRPKPDPKLPPSMRTLFSENNRDLSQEDLNSLCASQFQKLQISDDQIDYICKSTTSQSDSMMWHEQREGRITSSTVHSVIRTDQENPAKSTISNICNPKKRQFNSNPIKWGNENEEKGLKSYKQIITHSGTDAAHKNVSIKKDGFMISKQKPFIGVSTDSLMKCECHGLRVVEIKCPYTARDKDVKSFLSSSDCYIVNKELKKTHKYYSQVQLQMFVYNVQMCDFVIWSPKFVIVTYVPRDETFITNMLERCERFFKKHILPEMLTRRIELSVTTTTASIEPMKDIELYCICQQPEDDREYIGCDNPKCAVQWFHMSCLKMKRKPKGSWYCSSCTK